MGSTKKLGRAARFGGRYGFKVKYRWLAVDVPQHQKHVCPSCGYQKVRRLDVGVFSCKKCSFRFAGGAYIPTTLAGAIIQKMVQQRSFMPMVADLIKTTEVAAGEPGALAEQAAAQTDAETAVETEAEARPRTPKAHKKPEAK